MTKVRIHIESKIIKNVEINITRSQYHYLVNVMRKKDGDKILIFNENYGEWVALVSKKKKIELLPLKKTERDERLLDIWVCFSLIKPKNINYLVEKVSELGVSKFIPMITDFSLRTKIDINRLRKIAIESVEQSHGIRVPNFGELINIENLLNDWDESRLIIFCDENTNNYFFDIEKINVRKKYAIFLGPVGGWSSHDRKTIQNLENQFCVSLGKRLLKADTAAICAVSSLKLLIEKELNV